MHNESRLLKAFGASDFAVAELPRKISGIMISRILIGEALGCSFCFPHGFEVVNRREDKIQRSWKAHRRRQWR